MTQDIHTIVIGRGSVGVRFVHKKAAKRVGGKITLFRNAPVRPNNRVPSLFLLAGQIAPNDIQLPLPDESDNFSFIRCAIAARVHVPNIGGLDQTSVCTFRTLKDAEYLCALTSRARNIIIVGGGLLGIETARVLLKNNARDSLIQQGVPRERKQWRANYWH